MVPIGNDGCMNAQDPRNQSVSHDAPMNERGRVYDPDAPDSERTYAMLLHLSLLAHLVLSGFAIIVPLIMWLTKKDESPFVDDHGREAINFQISLIIYSVVFAILAVVIGLITCGIGFVLAFVPYVIGLVGMIQACVASSKGEFYRYPMTIRFLS